MAQLLTSVVLPLLILSGGLAGCTSGTSTEPTAAADAGEGAGGTTLMGTLAVRMTDEPADDLCELHVFIRDLRVKPAESPQRLLGTEIGGFDLLTLQDGRTALLGTFVTERGRYQFIEMLLDEGRSYAVEKEDPSDPSNPNCLETPAPLQVPSEKFKVSGGPFSVDESTEITIDFDARRSLKKKGNANDGDKGWQLTPEVSIVSVAP